jgi:predicted nucleic acid-binding protein
MYLLDTSAIIEIVDLSETGKKIISFLRDSVVKTSSFTVHEFLIGVRLTEAKKMMSFFDEIEVLPYAYTTAKRSVEIERMLLSKGGPINKMDILIAAICLENNLSIVTCDDDFLKVPGLTTELFVIDT